MKRSRPLFRVFNCPLLVLGCLILIAIPSYGQKMAAYKQIGDIPYHIEAEGWNGFSFSVKDHFPDPVGDHRTNKVSSVIFGGARIRMGVTDDQPQLRRPEDYYYKVINREGKDITQARFFENRNTFMDTTLVINDFLFVDVYDTKTDTLRRSWYFKRIALSLELVSPVPEEGRILARNDTVTTIGFANKNRWPGKQLEFRTINGRDTSSWQPSGYIIVLDYLKANSDYVLQVRYPDQHESLQNYIIAVAPFWYQHPSFRWSLSLFLLLSVIFIWVAFYKRNTRLAIQKRKSIEQQLRTVQSQLNPHFIFNSMSSIQAMMNTGRIEEANEYLSEFSKLMRNTLKGSEKIYNQLDIEINVLDTYLKLEQIRFGFNYEINVQHGLDPTGIEVPVLLFQPLVENAVKHGVSGLKENGIIILNFFPMGRNFICEIRDNGTGYLYEQQVSGYGIKLTADRIKLINEMTKQKTVELSVESSGGTVIKVTFNDWL